VVANSAFSVPFFSSIGSSSLGRLSVKAEPGQGATNPLPEDIHGHGFRILVGQPSGSSAENEVGGAFTDHDCGRICIATGQRRHDRRIDHPQLFDAMNL
jgi:hypothetical protein